MRSEPQREEAQQRTAIAVRLRYFASLRDQAGRSDEEWSTASATAAELFDELRSRHQFKLTTDHVRVAVNGCYVPWDTDLRQGDEVVFIPPVSGG